MGAYCLEGQFVKAQVGEVLHIQQFPHKTIAVANAMNKPVCIPHDGCNLELITVDPGLAQHPVLAGLRSGQTVHHEIQGKGQNEKDVVTLKTGATADLKQLMGCTFQITEEKAS